ncbi:hypothetical protein AAG570_004024 [Ranatra chinensis]|uniref:OAR domain-containing protein n=1 Tax=Ranatra chinensis TaxID=642074 RepID=A0ABD0YKQ0_9HEMI
MNAAAAAAADFKTAGFVGTQFNGLMQPFTDTESLYSSYSYNNWASKVPSPLGTKTFPWSVNPLSTINHHQSSVNCFNTMGGGGGGGSGGAMAPLGGGNSPAHHHHSARSPPEPSSSLATLRLKAKQHAAPTPASLSACQYAPPL